MKQTNDLVEQALRQILQTPTDTPEVLFASMRYSVMAGGKRIRPFLCLEALKLFGENIEDGVPFACAIELIHTYSLIHDDLPAMDNDDMRRGKPTNHIQFGENMAILAGDALLNLAHEQMIENIKDPYTLQAAKIISAGAGYQGMISGQVVDILSENKKIDPDTLGYIHRKKTGALITASLLAGATVGKANEKDLAVIKTVGDAIGMAFQIQDDVLDVVGDEKKLGKPVGSDDKNHKTTYVTFYGLNKARAEYDRLFKQALELLRQYGQKADNLQKFIQSMAERDS